MLWLPRGVSEPVPEIWPESDSHAVFLQHDVLVGISRHLGGDEREARFGFLLGHLFRCPESGRGYVVADTAVAAREVLAEEASDACLIRAWSEAQSVFSGHSGLLLGWYHSHWRLGPVLTEADIETAARYFSAPWQFSIVVVPDEQDPRGGVFHHIPGEAGATPRLVPFYERLGEPHGGDLEAVELAIAWSNHEPRAPAPPPPQEPPRAEERSRAPRLEPWLEEDAPPASSRSDRDTGRGQPGAARLRTVAHPPRGGHGDRPATVPLVIPGDGDQVGLLPPRARRVSWPAIVVGICLLAIALFFLLSEGDDGPVPTTPSSATRATPTPDLQRLLDQVEAVEIAGERYAERAADFDAGRIGCDLLTTGYVAADEAYVGVASAYRQLGEDVNPRAAAAYETAGEEIAAVNTHFDQSGCPRP